MTSSTGSKFNSAADALSARLVEAALAHASSDDIGSLLREGGSPDATVPDFGPLLTYAVRQGKDGLVRQLAEAGATIDGRDAGGETALSWAAHYGLADIVEYLLEQGADPTLRNAEGMTACHKAKQTADDMDPDDPRRSVEDVQNSYQRLGRIQMMLIEAETALAAAAVAAEKKKAPEIFHEGLSCHMTVRAPFKLRISRR